MEPDLQFSNLVSFAACTPITDRGREWLAENIDDDGLGDGTVYIEFRYLEDIVTGARDDGLICHG